jgi:Mitochondrial K+-H+ exchange-related
MNWEHALQSWRVQVPDSPGDSGSSRDTTGMIVKIYLLFTDGGRYFFYSDDSDASDERSPEDAAAGAAKSGIHGWLHTKFVRLRSAWQHAETGLTARLRRVWDWLHSWSHPDEWMLVRLRSAGKIELRHPGSRSDEEVLAIWGTYLSQQWRHHLVWLSVNTVIAPFSVLFAILPGPNVIGYWFAYRAIHHLLVVWGIRLVRGGTIPTELCPVAALDLPIERGADGKARHSALGDPASLLDAHVSFSARSQVLPVLDPSEPRRGEAPTQRP